MSQLKNSLYEEVHMKERENKKAKKKAGIGCLVMVLVLVGIGLAMYGFPKKASDFTEEEHLRRVETRMKKRPGVWTYDDGSHYTGFSVYPLYNEKDELEYCLIEYEPYGFTFVRIRDEPPRFIQCTPLNASMYVKSRIIYKEWSPYTIDETNSQPPPFEDRCWILDEKGEKIVYRKSPYCVTQNIKEKKYLLETNEANEYVCAVKRGEKHINLIDGSEFDIEKGDLRKKQPTVYISFFAKTNATEI